MRQVTILAILCVGLVTVLAIPTPNQASIPQLSEKDEIRNTLKTLDLMDITIQDYMANLIYAILKISAGQFLTSIDNAMHNLKYEISQGMLTLQQLMPRLDPNTQGKVQSVVNKALEDALNSIQPILGDLGRVLPSITRTASSKSVSEIIQVLLQISFEDFLIKITAVLDQSIEILTTTMGELSTIANTIPDAVANDLRRISTTYLDKGRSIIRPVLTDLRKVIPRRDAVDVFADVISESMGFDVVTTSMKLDEALDQVENTMTDFVKQINNLLGFSNPSTRNQVNRILKESVREVESTIDPILKVFLHFLPTSADVQNPRGDYTDIISTLLGVSLEDFLFYVDFAIPRIQEVYNNAVIDIKNSCASTQPFLLIQILQLIDGTRAKIDRAVEPFITQIAPILGDKRWVSVEEFVEISKGDDAGREQVFCNFSMRSGYNKDLIIHLISKIFGFDVVAAATEMSKSLYEVDRLYTDSGNQLNELITDLHPFVVAEVNRILNTSLNMTRRVMQPAIGVFIEFIPTEGRHDKDVVRGIVHALEGLKYEQFKNYVKISTEKSVEIAQSTMYHVHQIVKSGRPQKDGRLDKSSSPPEPVLEQVDAVMLETLLATQDIAEPFYNVISPIFEP